MKIKTKIKIKLSEPFAHIQFFRMKEHQQYYLEDIYFTLNALMTGSEIEETIYDLQIVDKL